MSDETAGAGDAINKARSEAGAQRQPPVIEGQAVEVAAGAGTSDANAPAAAGPTVESPSAGPDAAQDETETAQTAQGDNEAQDTQDADAPRRKKSPVGLVVGVIAGVAAIGAGGYYGLGHQGAGAALGDWTAALFKGEAAKPAADGKSVDSKAVDGKAAESTPVASKSADAAAPAQTESAPAAPAAEASREPPKKDEAVAAAPPEAAKAPAPPASPAEGKTEATPPADASSAPAAPASSQDTQQIRGAARDDKAGAPATPAPPATAPEKPASGSASADNPATAPAKGAAPDASRPAAVAQASDDANARAPTDMAAKLAALQAKLDDVGQRLSAVEGQLAAPKTDARAQASARDAGPANAGEASARIVAAQSLLTALKQGEDYAPMLAAAEKFGMDKGRAEKLRAGLAAPDAKKLAADFAALAPKIVAASAPAPAAQAETAAPGGFGDRLATFLETQAKKIVRVRPAGAPDGDAATQRIDKVGKALARNDIAAALAERAQLPQPALGVTADWASAAQTRLDAEAAARAELAQALDNLSKSKS